MAQWKGARLRTERFWVRPPVGLYLFFFYCDNGLFFSSSFNLLFWVASRCTARDNMQALSLRSSIRTKTSNKSRSLLSSAFIMRGSAGLALFARRSLLFIATKHALESTSLLFAPLLLLVRHPTEVSSERFMICRPLEFNSQRLVLRVKFDSLGEGLLGQVEVFLPGMGLCFSVNSFYILRVYFQRLYPKVSVRKKRISLYTCEQASIASVYRFSCR
jgi:hypothetical protein